MVFMLTQVMNEYCARLLFETITSCNPAIDLIFTDPVYAIQLQPYN